MKSKMKKRFTILLSLVMMTVMLTGCGPVRMAMEYFQFLNYIKHQIVQGIIPQSERPDNYPDLSDYYGSGDDYYAVNPEDDAEDENEDNKPEYPDGFELAGVDGVAGETIMVYMVGSDLESEYGNATLDMEEMMASDFDTENNNLVIYTGGAADWQYEEITTNRNYTFILNEDNEFQIMQSTLSKNMGEKDTLSGFINYCLDNFESEHYSLILWNHGAGPVFGFGLDENYQDLLTLEEMEAAFEESVGTQGKKLEWVGFDACLMNSMEIAEVLSPYANYMIASQETEPGFGWDYSFLSAVSDKTIDGDEMGRMIIDQYVLYFETIFEIYPKSYCDLTLSCIDLNKFETAEAKLDSFFGAMNTDLTVATYPELVRKREHTKDFGTYASSFDYGMVDVIHLLNQIAPDDAKAEEAIEAIEAMVVYSRANMSNANGISICYPYSTDNEYAESYLDNQENMDFSPEYLGFLQKFYAIQNGDTIATDWDFAGAKVTVDTIEAGQELVGEAVSVDTSAITLQLTEEQQANFASADYFILSNLEGIGMLTEEDDERVEEMYMFNHLGKNVTLDENGVLSAYYGNQAMYIYDATEDTYSPVPMILIETRAEKDNESRYNASVLLYNWNLAEFDDWVTETAELQIVVDEENPNGIIRSAVPLQDEDEVSPSKQLLDLEDFGILETVSRGSYFTRGENGEMINFYDWEQSEWYVGISQDLTHDYRLEMRPLDKPEHYYCVFRIKDVQGNVSYSEMIPLK